MRKSSSILSAPIWLGFIGLLSLFPLISILHPRLPGFIVPPGVQVFLWFSLVVVLLMICMPVLWAVVAITRVPEQRPN